MRFLPYFKLTRRLTVLGLLLVAIGLGLVFIPALLTQIIGIFLMGWGSALALAAMIVQREIVKARPVVKELTV